MEQRSAQWFEARKGKVTASVVGAILGLYPNGNRDDVMRRMVREAVGAEPEDQPNIAMAYGTNNEDGAKAEYEIETGDTVQDVGFLVHPELDWLGASPDGLLGEDGLLEIKCPFSKRGLDGVTEFKPISEQPHYYAQVQVQLFVSGRKWAAFYQWSPRGTKLELVQRDDEWLADAIPKLAAFYAEFLEEVKNPWRHLEAKRQVIDTPAAHKMMAEWDQLTEAIELAGDRKKELLEAMAAMAGDKSSIFAGRNLTKVSKAGAVSYAKAIDHYAPNADLEPFRGKPSTYWQVK